MKKFLVGIAAFIASISIFAGIGNVEKAYADTACPGDHEVHAGETYQVPAGCIVKGDVKVGPSSNGPWEVRYPSEADNGSLVVFIQTGWIYAQWGANVSNRTLDSLQAELYSSGCGSHCNHTYTTYWGTATTVTTTTVVCDPSIPKGGKLLVPVGCTVSGDVFTSWTGVDGTWHFEGRGIQTDGTIVVVKTAPLWVWAPYGASATDADPNAVALTMKQVGCGLPNGCLTVTIVTK